MSDGVTRTLISVEPAANGIDYYFDVRLSWTTGRWWWKRQHAIERTFYGAGGLYHAADDGPRPNLTTECWLAEQWNKARRSPRESDR